MRKSMLHFLCPPPSLKSGSDVVGVRSAKEMCNLGVKCQCRNLSSELLAQKMELGKNRFLRKFYKEVACPIGLAKIIPSIKTNDLVWINGVSRLRKEQDTRFEEAILRKRAKYIFHLQDYWFNTPKWNEAACKRIDMADLVVVVSHELKQQVLQRYPNAKVVFLEEPIDVDRVKPIEDIVRPDLPVLVWTGNPLNLLNHFPELIDILAAVHRKVPFILRIVSGSQKPKIEFPFPMEWVPYSLAKESMHLSGAAAGLAPLEDSVYARCKDVYKVKTYMAAGVTPLASGIGHCINVIRHGKTGLMFNTPAEWKAGLLQILKNPVQTQAMGSAARTFCVEHFSHKTVIPNWLDALKHHFTEACIGD